MKVYLTPDFINDLKSASSIGFVQRALKSTISRDGSFRVAASDDHRFRGIDDAWIRYISRGDRVIYIQQDDSCFLYRAGHHDIENNLTPPSRLAQSVVVKGVEAAPTHGESYHDTGAILSTFAPTLLDRYLKSMYHKGHHEIYLIAPFVAPSIFSPKHHFGRFLDRAIEEGTAVVLVTLPLEGNMDFLISLEKREIIAYVCPRLHAKLFLFDVDRATLNAYNRDTKRTAIIGSANLTPQGLGFEETTSNHEVCYRVPDFLYADVKSYAEKIVQKAEDPRKYWRRTQGK